MSKKINKPPTNTLLTKARSIPNIATALSINQVFNTENLDLLTLTKQLTKQHKDLLEGKTAYIEEVLISQAQTLQAVFHYAVERISQTETLFGMQAYADLAFKANNNCRKTILALTQIKNPTSAMFIKQQNNAVNQQINFSDAEREANKYDSSDKQANELLSSGATHEMLDTRRAHEAITINSQVETVE